VNRASQELLRRTVGVLANIVQEKFRSDVHCLVHLNQVVTVPLELNSLIAPLKLRQDLTAQSACMNAPSAIRDYLGCMCRDKSLDANVRYVARDESRPLKPSDRIQAEAFLKNKRRVFTILAVRDREALSARDRMIIRGWRMARRKYEKIWILQDLTSSTWRQPKAPTTRCWTRLTCLVPAAPLTAHHSEALHQLGAALGCQFVPVPLPCAGDQAAHLGVVLGAVIHQRQLTGHKRQNPVADVLALTSRIRIQKRRGGCLAGPSVRVQPLVKRKRGQSAATRWYAAICPLQYRLVA